MTFRNLRSSRTTSFSLRSSPSFVSLFFTHLFSSSPPSRLTTTFLHIDPCRIRNIIHVRCSHSRSSLRQHRDPRQIATRAFEVRRRKPIAVSRLHFLRSQLWKASPDYLFDRDELNDLPYLDAVRSFLRSTSPPSTHSTRLLLFLRRAGRSRIPSKVPSWTRNPPSCYSGRHHPSQCSSEEYQDGRDDPGDSD